MEKIGDFIKDPQRFHETYSKEEMLEYAKKRKEEARKTRTTFEVEEIRGVCPIYKVGDKACVIDSDIHEEINYGLTDRTCMALIDNMHYRVAWTRSKRPEVGYLIPTNKENQSALKVHKGVTDGR